MAYRILHFADLHLDRAFGDLGRVSSPEGRARRNDLRQVLRQICDLALTQGVDALTIGGDLYESERVTTDTSNFLRMTFEELAPVRVVISPGNHDPYTPASLYRQTEWPSNVRIFTSPTLEPMNIDGGLEIWGAAHTSPASRDNLVKGVRVAAQGTHLLLLHASDTSRIPTDKPAHCPFEPQDIADAGFSVALLGHYHQTSDHMVGNSRYIYPGSPEPLGFDEEGERYAVLVDISEGDVEITPHKVNLKSYHNVTLDVTDAESSEDIRRRVADLPIGGDANFVRVRLIGHVSPAVDLNAESLVDDCKDSFGFLYVLDETRPQYDLEVLSDELTVRGRFVTKLMSRMEQAASDKERLEFENALFDGLRALDGHEIHRR